MTTRKRHLGIIDTGSAVDVHVSKPDHTGQEENEKSVGKVLGKISISKTDVRYWQQPRKLLKWKGSANYSIWLQFKGQRISLSTRTPNRNSAAKIAAGMYQDLTSLGAEATIAKHRGLTPSDEIATVGKWITEARKVSEANESTFTSYGRALRLIAGGIIELKKDSKRFGPKKGGSTKYRATIDALSLSTLEPGAIQKWRLSYVKKAKNPAAERSAMTSCNSMVRQARSLFAGKVIKFLPELKLPDPLPFAGVEFFPRQNAKYISKIDPKEILQKAKVELSKEKPSVFLALLLSLGAGLRRHEIDSLCWPQVDTVKKVIRVEVTEVASLKTQDSRGEVEIDDNLAIVLQGFKALAKGKGYVIQAEGTGGVKKWGQHYRADIPFSELIAWLRNHEQDGKKPLENVRKPIHELRKELGALITSEHGIYAASRALRHSNVATTAAHYADKKERTTVDIGGWLEPDSVISLNEVNQETPSKKAAS